MSRAISSFMLDNPVAVAVKMVFTAAVLTGMLVVCSLDGLVRAVRR